MQGDARRVRCRCIQQSTPAWSGRRRLKSCNPSPPLVSKNVALTHESSRVSLIRPDLSVDLDQSLLDNSSDLSAGKGVLQSVTEEDGEGERLAELVRTGRRSGRVGPAELVEHP